jgi:hypothetical protein
MSLMTSPLLAVNNGFEYTTNVSFSDREKDKCVIMGYSLASRSYNLSSAARAPSEFERLSAVPEP